MGFFLVALGVYVAWMILGGVRGTAARQAGQRHGSGVSNRPDAIRRMMEALEEAQRQRLDRIAPRRPAAVKAKPVVAAAEDFDDEAAEVIARRREQVERRNRILAADEHAAFDERMKEAERARGAARHQTAAGVTRLRDAFIWREILGPPMSMRDPGGR